MRFLLALCLVAGLGGCVAAAPNPTGMWRGPSNPTFYACHPHAVKHGFCRLNKKVYA